MVKMLDAYTYANYVNEGVINGAAYDNLPYSYLPYRGKWNYRRDENDKIRSVTPVNTMLHRKIISTLAIVKMNMA